MNEKEKNDYRRRMQESMRALSPEEMYELQKKHSVGSQNSAHPYGNASQQNFYMDDQFAPIQHLSKLTKLQRVLNWVFGR